MAFKFISNYITEIALSNNTPILVTGAAGNVGSVGRDVVKLLRERDLQVRALVHRLGEQVLNWSGVPVAHVRSTIFLEPFFSRLATSSITKDGTIRLPFGSARTSPISSSDVARVVSTILEDPADHRGKVYELTGPRSEDMNEIAKEYTIALNRPVKYVDTPYDKWLKEELLPLNLPQYVFHHVSTMAKLIAENRYDRLTSDVQKLTGKPSMSVREYVTAHQEVFFTAQSRVR